MSDEAKESRSRSLDRLPYGDQSDDAIHVRLVSLHRYVVRYEMIMEYTDCTHVVYFFTHATYHHCAVLVVHKYKERNECIRGMGVF